MKVQFSKSTRRIEMKLIRDNGNSFSADYTAKELEEIRDAIDKYLEKGSQSDPESAAYLFRKNKERV